LISGVTSSSQGKDAKMLQRTAPTLILLSLVAAGCGPAETPPAVPTETPEVEPADTEVPPTKKPTRTPTPVPPTQTPLPEGVLFRDDFEGSLQPGWEWRNEDPTRWSFVENGWLEIVGDDISLFMEEERGMINFLTRDLPEGEFAIVTHVQADPDESFEQAAIYIFEDEDNYIALNLGYCGVCGVGGPGYFMETFIDNNPFGNHYEVPRDPSATDVLLKLVNQAGSITGYYMETDGEWQRLGAFGHFFEFNSVGLGATNSNAEGVEEDIVARFEYFEITEP
jgi:hypothetical protein